MTSNQVVSLVPGKTDAELAASHKNAAIEALQPILLAMDDGKKDGFVISFAVGQDFSGRHVIATLNISKNF